MRLILPWSLPAIVGIACYITSWVLALAVPVSSYHPFAHDVQMACNRIFSFLSLIGPVTAIFAIIAVYKSSYSFRTRMPWYVLNAIWGLFTCMLSVQFWFWYAHKT